MDAFAFPFLSTVSLYWWEKELSVLGVRESDLDVYLEGQGQYHFLNWQSIAVDPMIISSDSQVIGFTLIYLYFNQSFLFLFVSLLRKPTNHRPLLLWLSTQIRRPIVLHSARQ